MFAERLKQARTFNRLTQQQLSVALGIDKSSIGKMENNKLEPRLQILRDMADQLGVSVDFLLGRYNYAETTWSVAEQLSMRPEEVESAILNRVAGNIDVQQTKDAIKNDDYQIISIMNELSSYLGLFKFENKTQILNLVENLLYLAVKTDSKPWLEELSNLILRISDLTEQKGNDYIHAYVAYFKDVNSYSEIIDALKQLSSDAIEHLKKFLVSIV